MRKIITILLATALGVIACMAQPAVDSIITDSIDTVELESTQVINDAATNTLASGFCAGACFIVLLTMISTLSFNNTYKSTSFWPEIKVHSKISACLAIVSAILSLITLLLL